jgi:hypothetical protein
MRTLMSILNRTIMTAGILALASTMSDASEVVTVQLESGKHLTAQIDPRTDENRLWLRFGTGSTIIRRAIHWQDVADAQHEGESIDQAGLQALAANASDAATPPQPAPSHAAGKSDADRARELLDFGRRVTAIDFDAKIANWDGDVEFDGVALRLFPVDQHGRLSKVRGTLEAELVVDRKQDFNHAPTRRGHQPRQLGRWTVALKEGDITEDGILVKLPFQSAHHPEFDTKWAPYGLMHVKLVVPGHGVFEHSFDGLRIRPYSPLRDSMERSTGRRFLPGEQTSLGKRAVN